MGVVALSIEKPYTTTQMDALAVQKRKWTRRKGIQKNIGTLIKGRGTKCSKTQLVNVMVIEGFVEDCVNKENKRKRERTYGIDQSTLHKFTLGEEVEKILEK